MVADLRAGVYEALVLDAAASDSAAAAAAAAVIAGRVKLIRKPWLLTCALACTTLDAL
jgi:hypothetical protein